MRAVGFDKIIVAPEGIGHRCMPMRVGRQARGSKPFEVPPQAAYDGNCPACKHPERFAQPPACATGWQGCKLGSSTRLSLQPQALDTGTCPWVWGGAWVGASPAGTATPSTACVGPVQVAMTLGVGCGPTSGRCQPRLSSDDDASVSEDFEEMRAKRDAEEPLRRPTSRGGRSEKVCTCSAVD
eukprot:CAMPEP_0115375830 /NCGR_PEP_ID=MMETSP0271-20121206/2661_1 /TAXON_ID=71861 /ORGANISM="Scrippsiella trochoidea, Strain CCMP3099" /LENGTH=182 /DNA_ID=CAMNT_0002798899 /DNA_START=1182 /DNA_END=1731 /DNA_ORIENTATION=-